MILYEMRIPTDLPQQIKITKGLKSSLLKHRFH